MSCCYKKHVVIVVTCQKKLRPWHKCKLSWHMSKGFTKLLAEQVMHFWALHCKRCMLQSDVARGRSPFCPVYSCTLEISQFFWPLPTYLSLISEGKKKIFFPPHPLKDALSSYNFQPFADIRTKQEMNGGVHVEVCILFMPLS